MATSKATTHPQNNVLPNYCDICWGSDGFRGMKLIQCRSCGVAVHAICYGLAAAKPEEEEFCCGACAAIGTRVHTRNPKTGKEAVIKVTQRPTACCLCGVDNHNEFLHSMHPLYDNHGASGRQILLPDKSPAWAHTLCCLVIGSYAYTKGCVYGCMADGSYQFADGTTVSSNGDDNDSASASVHHYAYVIPKYHENDPEYEPYIKAIRQFQQLKCIYCGKHDEGSYRIAIQCCANDPQELVDFSGVHHELRGDTCYQAQHVGCAIWRKRDDWPRHRHVYFFPGEQDGEYPDPVANVFCPAHVLDLEQAECSGVNILRYPGAAAAAAAAARRVSSSSTATREPPGAVAKQRALTNKVLNRPKKKLLGTSGRMKNPPPPPKRTKTKVSSPVIHATTTTKKAASNVVSASVVNQTSVASQSTARADSSKTDQKATAQKNGPDTAGNVVSKTKNPPPQPKRTKTKVSSPVIHATTTSKKAASNVPASVVNKTSVASQSTARADSKTDQKATSQKNGRDTGARNDVSKKQLASSSSETAHCQVQVESQQQIDDANYQTILTRLQERGTKPLDTIKAELQLQLDMSPTAFEPLWERAQRKDDDWSCLVIGRNYNPSAINFGVWDTMEDIGHRRRDAVYKKTPLK